MNITCCHHCMGRHEKCHAHCEEYLTQKILKILVDANEEKEKRISDGIKIQKEIQIAKTQHLKHIRRRK